jgi:hypothetical protein
LPSEPFCDEDTDDALRGAVDELVMKRLPTYRGDARAVLHALASLFAEIVLALPDAVADARDQDYSWGEIAELLGRPKRAVKRGYAAHTKERGTPFELD